MTDQFVGEIRTFGFNFAPVGWAQCNGQLIPIQQNTALFALIGTFYGGDGRTNFALPNLQGSAAVGQGQGPGLTEYFPGEVNGEPTETLSVIQMPAHDHVIGVSSAAGTSTAASSATAVGVPPTNAFGPAYNMVAMGANAGGGNPHNNMQPYLVVNFCIALQGIFPARG
jgi:microcystin-dependent protein